MTALLDARQLIAQRPRGPTIGPLDLSLAAGDWVALMGPNGGGKTTLLRALLGLDAPHSGSVQYAGSALRQDGSRLRRVSAVLQDESRTVLTAREIVALGFGHTRALTPREHEEVDDKLRVLSVHHLADVPTTRLSGGEWQRVRLARAFVAQAPLLILDEPTNHLDPNGRRAIVNILRAELRSGGLLCATHDSTLADACDRVFEVDHQVTALRSSAVRNTQAST